MGPRKAGSKLYALGMFGAVSILCGLLVAGLIVPFAAIASGVAKTAADGLESLPAELTITPQMERSKILMSDGSVLADFYDQNRIYETLSNIAPVMRKAQVAIEDHQFYEHGAIYLTGTLRALVRNSAGSSTQGGSTLTQQYVKQTLIENALANNDKQGVLKAQEQTMTRKIRELRYAVALEKKFTKDQILERYLNIAYYGDGSYGVEAAAHHYFDTTAAKLTLPQAAMLAGIVQNPDAYNPVNHPQAATHRRNVVIDRMAQLGIVSQAQAVQAKKTTFDASLVQTAKAGCFNSPFPFICDYAYRTILDKMTSLGKTPADRKNMLMRGGLTIQTVIDPAAQRSAEKAVNKLIAPTDPMISVGVTLQAKTGLIISMAQNRNVMGDAAGQTWINYAVEQRMGGAEGYQAGSTFKAFTAAAGIAQGMTPGHSINVEKGKNFRGDTFKDCSGSFVYGSDYTPASDSYGPMSMREAMARSVNGYFVELEEQTGICQAAQMAQRVGAKMANGGDLVKTYSQMPAFTLGVPEVTPLSMAEAYATFANRGIHCDPIVLKSAQTKSGKQLAVPSANCQQVIPAQVADAMNYTMGAVFSDIGTAAGLELPGGWSQAGKTGTIDKSAAVWFNGYTPDVVGVAMIAADKMAPIFKGKTYKSLVGLRGHGTGCPDFGCYINGFGGQDATKIWRGMMPAALKGMPKSKFVSPSDDTMNGKQITVPDVSGMSYQDAKATLEAAGLSTTVQYLDGYSYPYGTFLGTRPRAGRTISSGTTVIMYLASGQSGYVPQQPRRHRRTTRQSTQPANTAPAPAPTGQATVHTTNIATGQSTNKSTGKSSAKGNG